ncbi:bone morphogenetic protein 7-like isoform X1 [Dermatophagoides pteronyssinus]|uniref:Bone morphogenetic protein 7-like isoform X1 n=1 Tax=Dermatophagoides pteronyssinus TaxID=6956 RepID=A0A6P6XQU4_DERPT|nr:bone morphogenetic protein 7-like isoform X1 [Dermatophagoides pteronyssinus]
MTMKAKSILTTVLILINIINLCSWIIADNVTISEKPMQRRYFYTDDSMQQSIELKIDKQEHQQLQQRMLLAFGLKHKPRPKNYESEESASNFLINLYYSYNNGHPSPVQDSNLIPNEYLLNMAKSNMVISFNNQIRKQQNNSNLSYKLNRRFWFNISDIQSDSKIIAAELRIYRNETQQLKSNAQSFQMTLLQFVSNHGEIVNKSIVSIQINHQQKGWLRFNVTTALIDWLQFPDQNLGLYLQIRALSNNNTVITDQDLNLQSIGIVNRRGSKKYKPFMTAFIKLNAKNMLLTPSKRILRKKLRIRRNDADLFNSNSTESKYPFLKKGKASYKCQRHTLYVSFRDIKWDEWVIAPDGFSANYCHGICSFPTDDSMNATNHAIIQQLHRMMHHKVPRPVCATISLSPISILHLNNESNIILRKFDNMVAKSCGCV